MFYVDLLLTLWKLTCVFFTSFFLGVGEFSFQAKEKTEGKDEVLIRHFCSSGDEVLSLFLA